MTKPNETLPPPLSAQEQRDVDYWAMQAMFTYGGGFVAALGRAAQLADSGNLARLKAAFPEYWRQYVELGQGLKAIDRQNRERE